MAFIALDQLKEFPKIKTCSFLTWLSHTSFYFWLDYFVIHSLLPIVINQAYVFMIVNLWVFLYFRDSLSI